MNTASASATGAVQIGGEAQAALPHVGGDQLGKAGLVDRHLAALQRRDLARVLVDADDVMTEIGKAGPRNEADIAGADHRDAHEGTRTECGCRSLARRGVLTDRAGTARARASHRKCKRMSTNRAMNGRYERPRRR